MTVMELSLTQLTTKSLSPSGKVLRIKATDRDLRAFTKFMREAIYGFWSGKLGYIGFGNTMELAITYGYQAAWRNGAKECGIYPGDMTADERLVLEGRIATAISYIPGFGQFIYDNSKANGGKLKKTYPRAELWMNGYNTTKNIAMVMSCGNKKLLWRRHATDSCKTCLMMDGRVYRASTWEENDMYPQHPTNLECMRDANGVPVCRCEFVVTDKPVTRGAFPVVL